MDLRPDLIEIVKPNLQNEGISIDTSLTPEWVKSIDKPHYGKREMKEFNLQVNLVWLSHLYGDNAKQRVKKFLKRAYLKSMSSLEEKAPKTYEFMIARGLLPNPYPLGYRS